MLYLNDSNVEAVKAKYENYLGDKAKKRIRICFDTTVDTDAIEGFNYNTLEPKFVKENGRDAVNKVLGKSFATDDELHKHMKGHKTESALKIFDAKKVIKFSAYILDAITGLPELVYPLHDLTANVTHCGRICLHRKKINLSTVFAGHAVGLKEVEEGTWLVTFMDYDLGYIDLEEKTLQPLDNPFGPRVSPM